jgi:hypothetical protein
MSLIKKADVKNYFSARNRSEIHLQPPASQPDATCFSGDGSPRAAADKAYSVAQPLKQSSLSGRLEGAPILVKSGSGKVEAPEASKSAQA